MSNPSHSVTSDSRIIAPFLLNIHKPLTWSEHDDVRLNPGFLRKAFPGNPVLVGHVVDFRRPFCVTGDTDKDLNNMTLRVQSRDVFGALTPADEVVREGIHNLWTLTQADLVRRLEVNPTMWAERMKPDTDIEMLELTDERFGNNPSWVRDRLPGLFQHTIKHYVVETIKAARMEERRNFLALARVKPRGIYSLIEYWDLALVDRAAWLEELRKRLRGVTA